MYEIIHDYDFHKKISKEEKGKSSHVSIALNLSNCGQLTGIFIY